MSRFKWHRHSWREVQRKVVMGALERGQGFKFGGGVFDSGASDALYGYTLIEQRCEGCGRVRVEKFSGAMERR